MMHKMLGVIATVALLAGCNSEDSGGGGGLSFDVSGHWQLLIDDEGSFEPIFNLVVDPEGRFMATDGDETLIGHDTDSIKLAGSGVSGAGVTCVREGDSLTGFDCADLSFSLAIEDNDTLMGPLIIKHGSTEIRFQVKAVRLTELDQPVDIANLARSWSSVAETGGALQLDTDGSFTTSHPSGDVSTGVATEVANNVFRIEGEATFDDTSVAITGLGFIDQYGFLNVGVGAVNADSDVISTGDLYELLDE